MNMAETESTSESPSKKPRTNKPTIFDSFKKDFKFFDRLKQSYKLVCYESALTLLDIKACDAGVGYGVPFSKSSCATQPYMLEFFPLGSFFCPAMKILSQFLKNDIVPDDDVMQRLLAKLLMFLVDTEECLKTLKRVSDTDLVKTESVVAAVVAREYLAKLTLASKYTLDHYGRCACGICGICYDFKEVQFGDTSIGHKNAWHGSLDIIFDNPDVFIQMVEDPVSPGGKITVEVKTHNMQEQMSRSQILSEVIVFSFLQRKRHPAKSHFMVPSIAMTRDAVKFVFYDSEKDYLLESFEFPFLNPGRTINYEAVIATWFVINYKYLSSGTTSCLAKSPRSHFFEFAGEYLEVYKNLLQIGNVQKGYDQEHILSQRHIYSIGAKYDWPSDLEEFKDTI